MRTSASLLVACTALASMLASCTDPVLDDQIEALGPETGDANAEHRPGQPCVLCHSEFGTSSTVFRLAGTVFDAPTRIAGIAGVEVRIVDASGARFVALTNRVGNFFLSSAEGEVKFPVRVRISKDGVERVMLSHIGREPSCAGCHFDPPAAAPGKVHYKAFQAVGHLYLNPQ
jgi:hypothetical protein